MKQKSIASFFGKPVASAAAPSAKKTGDFESLNASSVHKDYKDAVKVEIATDKEVAETSPLPVAPAGKRLRRLKQVVEDDDAEQVSADKAVIEEPVEEGPALKKRKSEPSTQDTSKRLINAEPTGMDVETAAENTAGPTKESAANKASKSDSKQAVINAKPQPGPKVNRGKGKNGGKANSKADARKATEPEQYRGPSKGKASSLPHTAADAKADAETEEIDKGYAEIAGNDETEAGKGETGEEESSVPDTDEAEDKKLPKTPSLMKLVGGKAKATSKVDGVGAGAIEAAARHGTFNLKELATWESSKPVPYSFLVNTFEAIAETTKRLLIIQMVVNAFRAIIATTPEDLLPTVYLCTDRVAPAHTGIELGVGEAILIKALAQVTGRKEAIIKKQYEECGDLGMVAVQNKATQSTMFKPTPLTVAAVHKTFKEISMTSGQASQEKKKGLIVKLLVASQGSEAGYIMRSLQGKLRIGLAEQSVLVALAHAMLLQRAGATNKQGDLADQLEHAAQLVKAAYSECPSYDKLVPALLEQGIAALPQHCHFMPGVPVRPMLAKATTGVSEVLDKFQDCEFTCEYKYDGERAQIHMMEDGKVQIYSRNAEDTTSKYIDVAKRMASLLKPHVKSIVIDSEVVAWDRDSKRILPFQILSTRARKDVNEKDIKVQVCTFAFDCLYLNGKVLLKEPLTARREALYSALEEQEGLLQFALAKVSRDVEELETFLNDSVEHGTEGLIVKTLADTYEPSKRSSHWLKLKKDYLDGVGDTFDVVPIGGWHGKGKRTGLFGAYLLAIYDSDSETFQTISKLGTGFSEEVLKDLADSLRGHIIDKPKSYYKWGDAQEPDVWFDPVTVWEVKAADLSISPVHKAAIGLVDDSKGISIRFPRLVRVRDDKKPEDATSPEQVAEMYRKQAVVNSQKKQQIDEDGE